MRSLLHVLGSRLNHTARMIQADRRFLISQTREIVDEGRQASCNLECFLDSFASARSGGRGSSR